MSKPKRSQPKTTRGSTKKLVTLGLSRPVVVRFRKQDSVLEFRERYSRETLRVELVKVWHCAAIFQRAARSTTPKRLAQRRKGTLAFQLLGKPSKNVKAKEVGMGAARSGAKNESTK